MITRREPGARKVIADESMTQTMQGRYAREFEEVVCFQNSATVRSSPILTCTRCYPRPDTAFAAERALGASVNILLLLMARGYFKSCSVSGIQQHAANVGDS
jgi:hypothetical protein